MDPKYGSYLPTHRFNADQVPLSYVDGIDPTAQDKQRVGGLEKRQATLQVCFGPIGSLIKQPPLSIIFSGTGRRITAEEKTAYAPGIIVLWQPKARMDRPTSHEWLEKCWGPYEKTLPKGQKLLIMDNQDAQACGANE